MMEGFMPQKNDRFDEEQEAYAISIGVQAGILSTCGQCGDTYILKKDPCAIRSLVEECIDDDEDNDEVDLGPFHTKNELLFVITTVHSRLKQQHRCG